MRTETAMLERLVRPSFASSRRDLLPHVNLLLGYNKNAAKKQQCQENNR
jgi:hypothetical protein